MPNSPPFQTSTPDALRGLLLTSAPNSVAQQQIYDRLSYDDNLPSNKFVTLPNPPVQHVSYVLPRVACVPLATGKNYSYETMRMRSAAAIDP